jgi:hypothetical protein
MSPPLPLPAPPSADSQADRPSLPLTAVVRLGRKGAAFPQAGAQEQGGTPLLQGRMLAGLAALIKAGLLAISGDDLS